MPQYGAAVEAAKLDKALEFVRAGGRLAIPTATRLTIIDRKVLKSFEKAGLAATHKVIARGPFGFWHEVRGGVYARVLDGDLRAVKRTLKAEGVTTLYIKGPGVQRPKYRTVTI